MSVRILNNPSLRDPLSLIFDCYKCGAKFEVTTDDEELTLHVATSQMGVDEASFACPFCDNTCFCNLNGDEYQSLRFYVATRGKGEYSLGA